ncbi:MAG: AMP-dependent synthetase/ligase [Myxococcota bacterium]
MSVITEAVKQSPLWQTLPGRLRAHALARPESVALREKSHGIWRPTTWREYWEAVRVVGHGLHALGVEPGDHVAILSDNRPEWLYADLGAQGIGARGVGIYQTNPAADVAYVVSHSESKVLFCEDQEQVDKAVEIAAETPSVTAVVVFEPRGTLDYDDPRLMSWDAFIAQGRASMATLEADWFESRVDALDPSEASMVVYTSGTTGQPKGAMLSPRNALVIPDGMVAMSDSDETDLILSYLPLCHVAEKIFSLFVPLTTGCIVHFGEAIETVRDDLREVSPTIFLGVPRIWEKMHASVTLKMADSSWFKRTLFNRFTAMGEGIAERRRTGRLSLLDRLMWRLGDALVFRPLQERLGMRRCRFPVTGAAPVSAELLTWFHGIGVPIVEGYGQTECAGVSHCNPLGAPQLGSVGQGLPGVEVSLAEDGEILVRGPSVFVGYLHNAKATAETIDADGWLHTGDLGSMDAHGFTRITGRKKEIIITAGGKNLSPEKIENALKLSPYVKEAIAIGDRRKFVSALVQIDRDAVGDWAQRQGVVYTSFSDLAAKLEVIELVGREISVANDRLAQVEHVRAFRLLSKELNQDDGELTATQKVRRKVVGELHSELIESIYSGGRR